MENEKIYVVVPVYKVEAYLERCIDSILAQTYTNWELVLVDDGSPDQCGAICDRYAAEHANITVIHQENGGVSAARNTALAYVLEHGDQTRDWLNFIDSDDFVHPRYLEYLHRAAKEAGTEISSCGNIRTDSDEITAALCADLKYEIFTPENYWNWNNVKAGIVWGKLYRAHLFTDIVYPVGRIFEDGFVTYKILFQQTAIAVIWDKLYYWYINPNSITASGWTPAHIDAINALEEQLLFFKEKGYAKAYAPTVKFLFWHSAKQLMKVRALSPQYDGFVPEMKARQTRAFKLYAKEFGWFAAVTYWLEIRIVKPAKRVLKNESVISFLKRRIQKKLRR